MHTGALESDRAREAGARASRSTHTDDPQVDGQEGFLIVLRISFCRTHQWFECWEREERSGLECFGVQ